ncbi:MAG TPA: hypothetical protein VN736_19660 [Candidatus Limnocylindrales bacterium]|nr:hypothetical protein [Candidatus Limnocylindrales bacterium]
MFSSLLIIAISGLLLVYWFRYSCILLLQNFADESEAAAEGDERFSFAEVQRRLAAGEATENLYASLQRDYTVLTYLVQHAAGLELGGIEDRLLVLDYKVMQGWYRVTKTMFPDQAREALNEMATVVGVLVHKVSAQTGA